MKKEVLKKTDVIILYNKNKNYMHSRFNNDAHLKIRRTFLICWLEQVLSERKLCAPLRVFKSYQAKFRNFSHFYCVSGVIINESTRI